MEKAPTAARSAPVRSIWTSAGPVLLKFPRYGDEPVLGDVPDAGRDPVDEKTVVRNEYNRPVILGEHLLECLPRLNVEMVGRFVEHQQVGALQQEKHARANRDRSPPDSPETGRWKRHVPGKKESSEVGPRGFFAQWLGRPGWTAGSPRQAGVREPGRNSQP